MARSGRTPQASIPAPGAAAEIPLKRKKTRKNAPSIHSAIALHRQGDLDAAERCYHALLAANPNDPDALHFLGVLLHARGDDEAALASIDRSLALVPGYVDARINRGVIFEATGRPGDAERDYRKALELDPGHPTATGKLCRLLRAGDEAEAALEVYQAALAARPNDPGMLLDSGWLLWELGQNERALDTLQRALEFRDGFDATYQRIGALLSAAGRHEAALALFRKWYEAEPDNPVAKHKFLALEGSETPDRPAEDYIVEVFDRFAANFEDKLERLRYQAPALVRDALLRNGRPDHRLGRVCDLGCGTGLCGEVLHELVDALDGVDLSPKMLAVAERRGRYARLVADDLVRFLQQVETPYDTLVSADTLLYFGDIRPVLQAALGATAGGGLFVFTLEKLEGDEDGPYRLLSSGRYAHAREHVEELLAATGWTLVEMAEDMLRVEMRQPVEGLIVTARKP